MLRATFTLDDKQERKSSRHQDVEILKGNTNPKRGQMHAAAYVIPAVALFTYRSFCFFGKHLDGRLRLPRARILLSIAVADRAEHAGTVSLYFYFVSCLAWDPPDWIQRQQIDMGYIHREYVGARYCILALIDQSGEPVVFCAHGLIRLLLFCYLRRACFLL